VQSTCLRAVPHRQARRAFQAKDSWCLFPIRGVFSPSGLHSLHCYAEANNSSASPSPCESACRRAQIGTLFLTLLQDVGEGGGESAVRPTCWGSLGQFGLELPHLLEDGVPRRLTGGVIDEPYRSYDENDQTQHKKDGVACWPHHLRRGPYGTFAPRRAPRLRGGPDGPALQGQSARSVRTMRGTHHTRHPQRTGPGWASC